MKDFIWIYKKYGFRSAMYNFRPYARLKLILKIPRWFFHCWFGGMEKRYFFKKKIKTYWYCHSAWHISDIGLI